MKKYIITISRQYGSGGNFIAQKVAERLGISYYDREIIAKAASEDGLSEEYIEEMEHTRPSGFLYNLYMGAMGQDNVMPMPDQIFATESRIIKEIAERESAVIVGRCADYVLESHENTLNVYCHAPFSYRREFAKTKLDITKIKNLDHYIKKFDKSRENYYYYFTGNTWGQPNNYSLCINCEIGIEKVTDLIIRAKEVLIDGK